MSRAELIDYADKFNSVYFCGDSHYVAKIACGGVKELLVKILAREIKNGIAIIRPPYNFPIFNKF